MRDKAEGDLGGTTPINVYCLYQMTSDELGKIPPIRLDIFHLEQEGAKISPMSFQNQKPSSNILRFAFQIHMTWWSMKSQAKILVDCDLEFVTHPGI